VGLKAIEYVTTFQLEGEHTFSFRRLAGWFVDTLELFVDGHQVLTTQMSALTRKTYKHQSTVEGRLIEIVWKWGFSGDPLFIALVHEGRLLAVYGDQKALAKRLPLVTDESFAGSERIVSVQVERDEVDEIRSVEVTQDEFPLDNSSGSDVLSVEYEVSKSLSASVTVTGKEQIEAHIKGGLFSVLESQLAAHLSRVTAHTIGETTMRRQHLKFSVRPGEAVIYTVTWKANTRTGACYFRLGGRSLRVPYAVSYGLSFEIGSREWTAAKS